MTDNTKSFWIARDAVGARLWIASAPILVNDEGRVRFVDQEGSWTSAEHLPFILNIDLAPGECKEIRFEVVEEGNKMQDFNVAVHETATQYSISCDGCGISTRQTDDFATAIELALKFGFVAYYTEADGVLNFCPKCDVNPKQEKQP